ncbi:Uncharacterised protein [Candidatus Burarchaeum australiense]|nr:Uncharacterised protein [Candidatus Burarchaeum australiense]
MPETRRSCISRPVLISSAMLSSTMESEPPDLSAEANSDMLRSRVLDLMRLEMFASASTSEPDPMDLAVTHSISSLSGPISGLAAILSATTGTMPAFMFDAVMCSASGRTLSTMRALSSTLLCRRRSFTPKTNMKKNASSTSAKSAASKR